MEIFRPKTFLFPKRLNQQVWFRKGRLQSSLLCVPLIAVLYAIFFILVVVPQYVRASEIVGIDIGTKFIKIALLKRGSRPTMVLNRESKRKTQFVLQFAAENIRHFGSFAASNAARYPSSTFFNLKTLIGKKFDDEIAIRYSNDFGVKLEPDNVRGFLRVRLSSAADSESYAIEELLAMMFEHIRDLVLEELNETNNNKSVSAILTIPPFFEQVERQVLIEAAELAGINVLSLIHETTAVAVNYASTRTFLSPENIIFFDIGASSTSASLIQFSGKSVKIPLKINVLFTAYDRSVGGDRVDRILTEILAARFVESHPELKSILSNDREAHVRLLVEAERVKHALSVNKEANAFIEGLRDGKSLNSVITREELEKRLESEYKESILEPIRNILLRFAEKNQSNEQDGKVSGDKSSNKNGKNTKFVSEVDAMVLFGGGQRVPIVQKWLQELPGIKKILRHVDSDEAAVLGAVLYGATMSTAFRVRRLDILDHLPDSIFTSRKPEIITNALAEEGNLFFDNEKDNFGSTKNALLSATTVDIPVAPVCSVGLTLWKFHGGSRLKIGDIIVGGIVPGKFVEALVKIELNRNGMLVCRNTSLTTQTSHMLLGSKNITEDHSAELVMDFPPLKDSARSVFKSTLDRWKKVEKKIKERADAHNELESTIYNTRDKLEDERLVKLTTLEERENINNLRKLAEKWLADNEFTAETTQFQEKVATIQKPFQELQKRVDRWLQLLRRIRAHGITLNDTLVRRWADDVDDADVYNVTAVVEKVAELRTLVEAKAENDRKERERVKAEMDELLASMRKKEEEARMMKKAASIISKMNLTNSTSKILTTSASKENTVPITSAESESEKNKQNEDIKPEETFTKTEVKSDLEESNPTKTENLPIDPTGHEEEL